MNGKDFGLTGVTDKLKRSQVKGKSNTVESVVDRLGKDKPATVLTDEGKSVTVLPDFRQRPSAEVLQQAIATAKRKPRIGVYSPIVSAAVEYLRETIPKYSASDEARKILEDEFERRYPELVKQIKSGME
jgi:hypothetical protein